MELCRVTGEDRKNDSCLMAPNTATLKIQQNKETKNQQASLHTPEKR